MKKYRCVKPCWQLIGNRRHWEEGMTAEVEDDAVLSDCFELVGVERYVPPEKKSSNVETLSGLQKKQKEVASPKTGFAANLNSIEPERVNTR